MPWACNSSGDLYVTASASRVGKKGEQDSQRRRLDHDAEADLTRALPVIDLAADQERKGRGEPLLEQHADFTLAVDLSAEGGHAEFILGTEGRRRLALARAHGPVRRDERLKVKTDVDGRGQFLVVGRLEDALRLELGRGDPLFADARVDARRRGDRGRG